jgi:fibronectin type 3 domain-containing protein
MKRSVRAPIVFTAVALLAALSPALGSPVANAGTPAVTPAVVPAAPAGDELHANADSSITITWPASPGATSYRIYRGTSAGGEASTPIVSTANTTYTDVNLSPTPIYFYQITAVNASGESARTPEDASKTPPPIGTGGNVAGVTVGAGKVYYCEDALLGGFDWFQTLTGWFPGTITSDASLAPGGRVVDMAYADAATMTFNNVVVPTSGLYTVDWRYAYQSGLFGGVNNRQMGLSVNGTVITTTESFPITGNFETYADSALQVHLNAGTNSISQLAVSDHGLSRVDSMTVTPASASSPSAPTNLVATPGNTSVTLSWGASATGSPTSYSIFRGTQSDGEVNAAVGTVSGTTTTFTDTGLHNGTTYFYFVTANNAVGGSPTSAEVSVNAGVIDTTAPSAPTGLAATGTTATSTSLAWTASTDNVGVSGYDVLRNGATVATVTGTSYAATGLTASTAYTFQVKAHDAAGNVSGGSNTISVTTLPTGATNLALGQPTTASSAENAGDAAAKATDGNAGTRWSSAFADPQWLQVDLGTTRAVTKVVIQWETAYGKAYQIQVSPDATTWTTIYSTTTGAGGTETLNVTGSGRYIRVYGTQRSSQYGYSIWELQVFGS